MNAITVPFTDVAFAADVTQNIFSLMGIANRKLTLLSWELTSADIAAEGLSISLQRITNTGSAGNSETGVAVDEDEDQTIIGVVRTADTTQGASPGAVLESYQWEQVGPLMQKYLPEERYTISGANGIALVLNTATGFTGSGYVKWLE